jgi:hypothetical protein
MLLFLILPSRLARARFLAGSPRIFQRKQICLSDNESQCLLFDSYHTSSSA